MASIAVAAVLLSTPALAKHCPKDANLIGLRLKVMIAEKPGIENEPDVLEPKNLRKIGLDLHQSGNHDEALDALYKSMEMLGLKGH